MCEQPKFAIPVQSPAATIADGIALVLPALKTIAFAQLKTRTHSCRVHIITRKTCMKLELFFIDQRVQIPQKALEPEKRALMGVFGDRFTGRVKTACIFTDRLPLGREHSVGIKLWIDHTILYNSLFSLSSIAAFNCARYSSCFLLRSARRSNSS